MGKRIRLTRRSDGFIPFDEESAKVIERMPHGKYIVCDIKMPRNQRHHRKFFALLDATLQALDEDANTEDMLLYIKEKLGMFRLVAIGDVVAKEYDSISFEKMNQIEFEEFYDRAVDVLCHIAPLDKEVLDTIASFG